MNNKVDENPFLNKKFLKDIKRSFVPTKLFNKNKYDYNIINIEFKLKKNNLIQIILKREDGMKYEYTYLLSETTKQINNNDPINDVIHKLKKMDID